MCKKQKITTDFSAKVYAVFTGNVHRNVITNDCFFLLPGDPQDVRQGDGAEDEPTARQPAQHVARGAAYEQAETSQYTRVSLHNLRYILSNPIIYGKQKKAWEQDRKEIRLPTPRIQ